MKLRLWIGTCLLFLVRPAFAEPSWDKIRLKNLDSTKILQALLQASGMPSGIQGLLAFPTDNSLLVRGETSRLERMKNAFRKVDVGWTSQPGGESSVEIPVDPGTAEGGLKALKLLKPDVRPLIIDRTLRLTGRSDALYAAFGRLLALQMGSELTEPRTTITLAAGTELTYSGGAITYDADGRSFTARGPTVLKASNGFELRLTDQSVFVSIQADQPVRITFLPAGPPPAAPKPTQ